MPLCILGVVPRLSPSVLVVLLVLLAAGPGRPTFARQEPRIVQPGAPGQPSRVVTAAEAGETAGARHTPADVAFMQGMLGHHGQALEMTALVEAHSRTDAVRTLARRIDVSQRDEMLMMRDWLTRRGEAVPDAHAHAGHSVPLMPGMLSAGQMQALTAARGPDLDRRFLEGMIQHHQGALTMVETLFATPRAGQEPDIFGFAADVEADQRMDISRMRALLEEIHP